MRVLTGGTAAAAASPTPRPVTVLRIESPALGTLHYADRALSVPVVAEARVRDWGAFEAALDDGAVNPGGAVEVLLHDADGALRALAADPGFTGAAATVLQHFDPLGESDLVPLLAGRVHEAPVWHEQDASLSVRVADLARVVRDRPVGRLATREDFPRIPSGEEGRMLPIVYGRPHRVRAVLVEGGARTELVWAAAADEMALYVKDALRFPAGEIRLRIGEEELTGSFDGNTFTVTERGCAIHSGTTSEASGNPRIVRDASLPATEDNAYAGLHLSIEWGGRTQIRRIRYSVASTGALVVGAPFFGPEGDVAVVPANQPYAIATLAGDHPPGETVLEVLDEYVYVAAGHAVDAIETVEGWGILQPEVKAGKTVFTREERGYATLPPELYRVDPADSGSFPGLGHPVATVTLTRLPVHLAPAEFLDHAVYVTMTGPRESGALLERPDEVIRHLLVQHGGLDPAAIDDDAFGEAGAARADRAFAFALERPGSALARAAELAFQACLALHWEGGRAKLLPLRNDLAAPVATLDPSASSLGSVRVSHAGADEVVTGLRAEYAHRGMPAALSVRDAAAEDRHGRREETLRFWAYGARHHVRWCAEWWLRRWRHRYRRVTLSTFLAALALERGDTVTLDRPGLAATGQGGRVRAIEHRPGRAADGRADRITLTLELPVWEGCASTCEHACEQTACESAGCELACTVGAEVGCAWTCETTCEEACQIACTVTCELSCQGACMVSDTTDGCGGGCVTGCESTCEGWACESDSAETGCASTCQSEAVETVIPVRQVRVLGAPAGQYGMALAIQEDVDGNRFGDSFVVYDPFDVHPGTDDKATVYLNFNEQWVLVPSDREARYVRVLAAGSEADQFEVCEQDHLGNAWGASFLAWAVSPD